MSRYNSFGDSVSHPDFGAQPNFEGFQLMGASMLLRFAEQLLNKRRKKKDGLAYLGLCVSGQKVADLLSRIKNGFGPVSRKVILMIGTNDLLQNTHESLMVQGIQDLVCKLMEKVQTLIILTLPPVPQLAKDASHWKRLRIFNDRIKTLDNGNDIFVIDVYPEFVLKKWLPKRNWAFQRSHNNSLLSSRESRGACGYNIVEDDHDDRTGEEDLVSADEIIDLNYFEQFFFPTGKKDLIHLNNHGLRIIRELVYEKIRSLRKYR